MEERKYNLISVTPQFFGNTEEIKENIKKCSKCQANLIFQHVPNHEKMILKEVIRCALCTQKSVHHLHHIH